MTWPMRTRSRRRGFLKREMVAKEANQTPNPFRWTKNPDEIIAAVRRGHQTLDSHY
jgi:hypothetical protein